MHGKKKDNLNNRMALVGVTMVVLSLAVAVHIKGIDLKEKDRSYSIREGKSGGTGCERRRTCQTA